MALSLIDAHCHFDDPRLEPDREQAYHRARAAGVEAMVVSGIQAAWWPRIRQTCAAYPGLYAAWTSISRTRKRSDSCTTSRPSSPWPGSSTCRW